LKIDGCTSDPPKSKRGRHHRVHNVNSTKSSALRGIIATNPELSAFTSGQARAIARQARREIAKAPNNPTPAQ
jgi:hypothetical protein